jgi:thioredoxin-related protein
MKRFIFLLIGAVLFLQQSADAQETVKWLSIEEAEASLATAQKKIIVYIFTDWCGWCKRMERETFSNPTIAAYLNENFYAVKLDAEGADTLFYRGREFVNTDPGKKRHYHQLAQTLTQGRMSFPTVVYLDELMNPITAIPGFFTPEKFEPVLHYYNTNAYKKVEWEIYNRDFDGSL